ncbi:hypothetical protein ACWGDE_37035 [Streptomyces sp. NPDC054956]
MAGVGGVVLRRSVAGATAVVLVAEGALLAFVHLVLGRTTANQSMSIAGMDPDVMSTATYAMGAGMGGFLLLCAVLVAVAAIRDRAPGSFARVVLVTAAVTHGILGALVVGLVGWPAFALMMAILCLLVASLMLYGAKGAGPEGANGADGADGGPDIQDAPPGHPLLGDFGFGETGEIKPTSP